MIRQPDSITKEMFAAALETVKKKKPHPLLSEVFFSETEDGLSVQMLHTGSYDDEPHSFTKMKKFMDDNGLARREDSHREIYLTAGGKTPTDKLKTILRYTARKML
jgi:hypothetical protein